MVLSGENLKRGLDVCCDFLDGEYLKEAEITDSLTGCVAEGVGFEPTELSLNSFQDCRLKPLGHPSEKFEGAIIQFILEF